MLPKSPMVWVALGATLLLLGIWVGADFTSLQHTTLKSQTEVITINEPNRLQFFYGTLDLVPHTYEFSISEESRFVAHIMMPKVDTEGVISAILIKEPNGKGRVTEIARLSGVNAIWDKTYIGATGDTLLQGPSFDANLEPGVYRLEVHTPDNREPYVIQIGVDEQGPGYFAFLKQLREFKQFTGSASLTMFLSPALFVPIIFVLLGGYALHRRSRIKG